MFIILALSSTSMVTAEERHAARGRKLSNAPWLAAPHFQAFSKRGRFVFRDALDDYHHDFAENNDDDFLTDKRNWRL